MDILTLPILPTIFPDWIHSNHSINQWNNIATPAPNKSIPRNVWIGFRELPPHDEFDRYYSHINKMMSKSPEWIPHFFDDKRMDEFMNYYFKESAIHWAYFHLNDQIRVAASDIWRYCAVYAFGGLYMDDDAYIGVPLDEVRRVSSKKMKTNAIFYEKMNRIVKKIDCRRV